MPTPTLPTNTLLVIYEVGQPLYASRGLTQTYQPIKQALQQSRSVNGVAMDLSAEQFRGLIDSEITCTDFQSPSLNGVKAGKIITVDCAFEYSYLTATDSPAKSVVGGSTRIQGAFTFYRPSIVFMVVDFSVGFEEYKSEYAWKLALTEYGAPAP